MITWTAAGSTVAVAKVVRCLAATMLLSGWVGCVTYDGPDDPPFGRPDAAAGQVDGGSPDGSSAQARTAFIEVVHPIMANLCGGCHGPLEPKFVNAGSASRSYDLLTTTYPALLAGFSDTSPIVTYHVADTRPLIMWYSGAQLGLVKSWLAIERGEPTGP